MAIRVPNADNVEEFRNALKDGKELIDFYTDEELKEFGISEELIKNPNYVQASGVLEDKEYYEAELLDPQHKLFHECSWHAFENTGIDPEILKGLLEDVPEYKIIMILKKMSRTQ
ncbi:MAG: hypothetical protein GQ534_02250 [Candidatus Delongbacteria bacterium]|nr:hypothetical protein [Candidatus Delongbacteria bacterium]